MTTSWCGQSRSGPADPSSAGARHTSTAADGPVVGAGVSAAIGSSGSSSRPPSTTQAASSASSTTPTGATSP
ncbi:hypothetical protein E1283_36530, partial [Streptomyces hainanensis]